MQKTYVEKNIVRFDENWYCEYCGEEHSANTLAIEAEDGKYYCKDAIDEVIFKCGDCGNYFPKREIYMDNNHTLCEDCFNDSWCICEKCGKIENVMDATYVPEEDGYICGDCLDQFYFFCDHCNEYHYYTQWHTEANDGNTICDRALGEEYELCERCGRCFPQDDMYYSDRHEGYVCPDCYDQINFIHDYHDYPEDYVIDFTDKYLRDTKLHIGVELEIDGGGETVNNAHEILDGVNKSYCYNFVAMHDGSLDNGFEIISQPRTLESHLDGDWTYICSQALDLGYNSHDGGTCGLHFHLDRNYFEDSVDYEEKLSLLVIQLEAFLKVFSRRRDFYYCEFKRINSKSKKDLRELKRYKNANKGHYSALNFNGCDTVELRFCRGTLNINTLEASLQLAQILADIVKFCTLDDISNISSNAIKLIATQKGYAQILKYMEERGL